MVPVRPVLATWRFVAAGGRLPIRLITVTAVPAPVVSAAVTRTPTMASPLNPSAAAFQAEIRAGACERFTTVLGPGADAAHRTHFHFDLRDREGGYRLCQ